MKVSLTEDDIANLALQRTEPFVKLGGGPSLDHWFKTGEIRPLFLYLKETNQVELFVQSALKEIGNEYFESKPYIPNIEIRSIVSIGPGLGYFETLVCDAYKADITLVDIEDTSEHAHGFAMKGSGYNNLSSAKTFLTTHGIEAAHIQTCNPRKKSLPKAPFDLLISLLSMGFHYPCDEYTEFITNGLQKGGLMIVDKRLGVLDSGWDALSSCFETVKSIDNKKFSRKIMIRL